MNNRNDSTYQTSDLAYELLETDWIVKKTKKSNIYSQNLYSAICNNDFVKLDDIWNILQENYWTASWRSAGGIVADILGEGDYIDWYCSGMSDTPGYVSEGTITTEIRKDLRKIRWISVNKKKSI